jgi:hypothetical protein
MAISQAICNSWKTEILVAEHDFTTSTGHSFKAALYDAGTASLSKSTTAYTATGEVTGTNYTATGQALTNVTPTLDGDTAMVDFADVTWSSSTITADGALIYNDTHAGDAAVMVLDFGSSKSSSNGDFTIQFPTAAAATALIQLL